MVSQGKLQRPTKLKGNISYLGEVTNIPSKQSVSEIEQPTFKGNISLLGVSNKHIFPQSL